MQPLLLLKLLLLLGVANGAPLLAKTVFGGVLAQPLDCGLRFFDGRPLFGASKTLRGIVVALALPTATAPLLGLGWPVGALVGATAMAGDLFSSFCKRRFGMAPSTQAAGLDQIPEALFPLLACRGLLSLTAADIGLGVVAFIIGEVVLSRVFYRIGLRDRPY